MAATVYVLNGPNLDLLGERQPELYGRQTLADLGASCRRVAAELGLEVVFRQTNAEHEMVEWLHEARTAAAAIVLNPAAFSYTSVAVLDAVLMCECPVVEVHLTNLHRREPWRARSRITAAVTAMLTGFGPHGYELALRHVAALLAAGPGADARRG